jgi:alanine dehydrogenase
MKDTIEAVEKAFGDHSRGNTQMLQRTYLHIEKHHGRIGFMPAYIENLNGAGIKIVSAFHENPQTHNLPSIMATIVLNDTETGRPLAIMDGTYVTMVRTGAAGALAAKYLSRDDSKVAGIIGAGVQGRAQLMGLVEVRGIEKVKVYNRTSSKAKEYARDMSESLGVDIFPVDKVENAVKNVDVLATCTPVSTPIVEDTWVEPGLHINSVGPSTPGKQEISNATYLRSKLVVDDYSQTSKIGGISIPTSEGKLKKEDVYAELGEIVLGNKAGRLTDDEITVFVSSGLSIQDVATARLIYEKAKKENVGKRINLVG